MSLVKVHWNKGRIASEETRRKISEALKIQNVKVLKGYGVSISLKDNQILLKDGKNPFNEEQDKEAWFVSKIPYDKIIISGKGYISTEAIKLLSEKHINVILTDTYGNIISNMNNVMSSNTSTTYRMGQYDTFRDPERVAYLQKTNVKIKTTKSNRVSQISKEGRAHERYRPVERV